MIQTKNKLSLRLKFAFLLALVGSAGLLPSVSQSQEVRVLTAKANDIKLISAEAAHGIDLLRIVRPSDLSLTLREGDLFNVSLMSKGNPGSVFLSVNGEIVDSQALSDRKDQEQTLRLTIPKGIGLVREASLRLRGQFGLVKGVIKISHVPGPQVGEVTPPAQGMGWDTQVTPEPVVQEPISPRVEEERSERARVGGINQQGDRTERLPFEETPIEEGSGSVSPVEDHHPSTSIPVTAEEQRRTRDYQSQMDAKKAEEARLAEERLKVEEAKRAEEARLAEIAKKAEEERKAAEARLKAEREAKARQERLAREEQKRKARIEREERERRERAERLERERREAEQRRVYEERQRELRARFERQRRERLEQQRREREMRRRLSEERLAQPIEELPRSIMPCWEQLCIGDFVTDLRGRPGLIRAIGRDPSRRRAGICFLVEMDEDLGSVTCRYPGEVGKQ